LLSFITTRWWSASLVKMFKRESSFIWIKNVLLGSTQTWRWYCTYYMGWSWGVSIGTVWSVWGWVVQLWISDQPQFVGCPVGLSDQSEVVGCPVELSDQSEVIGCLLWMSDQSDVLVCPPGLLISLRLCCVRWDCLISLRMGVYTVNIWSA
jgi:hypothetical protein